MQAHSRNSSTFLKKPRSRVSCLVLLEFSHKYSESSSYDSILGLCSDTWVLGVPKGVSECKLLTLVSTLPPQELACRSLLTFQHLSHCVSRGRSYWSSSCLSTSHVNFLRSFHPLLDGLWQSPSHWVYELLHEAQLSPHSTLVLEYSSWIHRQ